MHFRDMSDRPPHVFFFPLMAYGHMLPTIEMAKLFASRGLKTTLLTTHGHAPMFNDAIQSSRNSGLQISVRSIKFPAAEVGLPEGIESLDQAKASDESLNKFTAATFLLQIPFEALLREYRPDILISDLFLPWAATAADKLGIPRFCFDGSSNFQFSVRENLLRYKPYRNAGSGSDPFLLPEFPRRVEFTRAQLPDFLIQEETGTEQAELIRRLADSNARCCGYIFNSFFQLEPDFIEYNQNRFGIQAWNIGPLFLQNSGTGTEDRARRGKESSIDPSKCLNWLDSKHPNSVLYVCFGSIVEFTAAQLHEIASGLGNSGHNFIWVVRNCADEEGNSNSFPQGFEKKVAGKGLIIKGWAPQRLILGHESVGAFVTHCGWNSVLEGVCSGKTMVTCPFFGDQFFNEKLLTDVLKIGASVGARRNSWVSTEVLEADSFRAAVDRVMVGEEAVEMRKRANVLKEMAMKAVEVGGSSDLEFHAFIQELKTCRSAATTEQST